jgi:hypothetical protein
MMPGVHLVDVHHDATLQNTRNAKVEYVECVISNFLTLGPGWGTYHVESVGPDVFPLIPEGNMDPFRQLIKPHRNS